MSEANNVTTRIKEFILVGFSGLHPDYYNLVGLILCLLYVSIIAANSTFVAMFVLKPCLHKPMYIVMFSLSLADMGFSTTALPKIIARYWFDDKIISFHACFIQRLLIHSFGSLNSFIMMVMALDRYLAICFPLRYPMLMTNCAMIGLNCFVWVFSLVPTSISWFYIYTLPYCGPNMIYQCYCDHNAIATLACADKSLSLLISFCLAMLVLLIPLAFIIYSYIHIALCVAKIGEAEGRWKTFSTCSSQMCIITIYYLPRCTVYVCRQVGISMNGNVNILIVLFYSLLPALVNPFIYCFRTKAIQQMLFQFVNGKCSGKSSIAIIS